MKQQAQRMAALPPYLFARIAKKIEDAKAKGVDIINLGIGDPDKPTPDYIIDRMTEQIKNPANHKYSTSVGILSFRQAVANWYRKRFNVELNPKTEIVNLIGSKEGIANINYCYVEPGDINLVPDPGYPVYSIGTLLAGGEPYYIPLLEKNQFLPDLDAIPVEVAKRAKILWINYPNNPTGAVATLEFFNQVVDFAKEYDIIVCHDNPYSEVTFDGYRAPSFLEAKGAKDVGIEFSSLSKPFNMTGWRIGWAAGNKDVIETLGRYKSNVDSGAFQAIQCVAAAALEGDLESVEAMKRVYEERRDIVIAGLNAMGWKLTNLKATFYVWVPVPKGYTSSEFAEMVLEKAGVVVTPGNGYGPNGDGFFRISLTVEKDRLQQALDRLKGTIGKVDF